MKDGELYMAIKCGGIGFIVGAIIINLGLVLLLPLDFVLERIFDIDRIAAYLGMGAVGFFSSLISYNY